MPILMPSFFGPISVRTLADLIAATATADETSPDSKNGWETDTAYRLVERLVIGRCSDHGAFADIAQRVLMMVYNLPEARVLSLLAKFNGVRRLPMNSGLEQVLAAMVGELEQAIAMLPDGTRKMRCRSFLKYQEGIFYDACGRFDLAAAMHIQSAYEASRINDAPGATIAQFCEMACRFKHALCQDKMDDADVWFQCMEGSFAQVVEATRNSPFQVSWAEDNCPACMLAACIWVDQAPKEWRAWVATLVATAKLAKVYEYDGRFAQAVEMAFMGNPEADAALIAISGDSVNPELQATVLLLLARRAMRAGKRDAATEFVNRMPKEGAQHVCAVAQRLLAINK
ncbi:MAG: hypothetical protein US35_C0019G0026 [Parcubacteria group bacterium GW2011_GWA2_37_10]|nr:MAG: hypothetical protein US35_C0019G0026 [Parcubacteria group bacterium GW2011_GWA2_37_10]